MYKVKSAVAELKNRWFIGKTAYEYYEYSVDSVPFGIYVTGALWYKIRFIVNFESFVDRSKTYNNEYKLLQIKEEDASKWSEIENFIKKYKKEMAEGIYYRFFPTCESAGLMYLIRRGLNVEKLPANCLEDYDKMLKVVECVLIATDFYSNCKSRYFIYMGNKKFYNEKQAVTEMKILPPKSYRIKWELIEREPETILKLIEDKVDTPLLLATAGIGLLSKFEVKGRVTEFQKYSTFITKEKLMKGDLIEKNSSVWYSHWMIYIGHIEGQHRIIHFAKDKKEQKLIVKEDTLEHGADGKFIRINNSCDDSNEPFDGDEIVERAKIDVGRADYGFFSNNCEHTAVWCRVGVFQSKQSELINYMKNVPVHPLISGRAWTEEMKKHPNARGNWFNNLTEIERYVWLERASEVYPDLM